MTETALMLMMLMPLWLLPAVIFGLRLASVAIDLGPDLVAATVEWAQERWRNRSRPGYGWPRPAEPEERP